MGEQLQRVQDLVEQVSKLKVAKKQADEKAQSLEAKREKDAVGEGYLTVRKVRGRG